MDSISPSVLQSLPPIPLTPRNHSTTHYVVLALSFYFLVLIGYTTIFLVLLIFDRCLNRLYQKFGGIGERPSLDLEQGQGGESRKSEETREQASYGIEKLLRVTHGTDVNRFSNGGCVICLEEFRQGEACWVLASCNHVFHHGCITYWLRKNRTCPMCRKVIDLDSTTA